jgi:ABC-type branched-subunit amino acid transport system permease subunit
MIFGGLLVLLLILLPRGIVPAIAARLSHGRALPASLTPHE